MPPPTENLHLGTVRNGGYRVLAVTSDGDTALQMLESTSDLIDAPMFVKASFGFGFSVVGVPVILLECWVRTSWLSQLAIAFVIFRIVP